MAEKRMTGDSGKMTAQIPEAAKRFLQEVSEKGDLLGLTSVLRLLEELGNPQQQLKVIAVVGTNGKGSICSYLEAVLAAAGYRVGVYTSPEVFSPFERFVCDGKEITPEEYDAVMADCEEAYRRIEAAGGPLSTIFEVETVAAILYFVRGKCDICIMEAGMGGDLDATNVFDSDAQVLVAVASIGMDHMAFLGDSLEEIAGHKAGILQEGGMMISAPQAPEVEQILREIAEEKGAEVCFADAKEWSDMLRIGIALSMAGDFQKINASVALAVVSALQKKGWKISDEAVREGMTRAFRPGRMETILSDPTVVLDGAHNVPAMREIAKEMAAWKAGGKRICLVLGVLADKDYEEELSLILDKADRLITVTSSSPRRMEAKELLTVARRVRQGILAIETDEETDRAQVAIDDGETDISSAAPDFTTAAKDALSSGCDVILCTGSLSILKDMRDAIVKEAKGGS